MLFTYKAFEHKQDLNNKITISRVVIHPMSSTPWSYLNAVGHVWCVLAGRGTESPLAWSCNWACVSLMASPDSECGSPADRPATPDTAEVQAALQQCPCNPRYYWDFGCMLAC